MQFVLEELAADMLHVSIRLFEINRRCHARYAILEARRFRNADDMLNRALDALDIHSDCLTFGTYTQTHSVYIKFCSSDSLSKFMHIGSTHQRLAEREHSRYRKFLQVMKDKLVAAEPAVRF